MKAAIGLFLFFFSLPTAGFVLSGMKSLASRPEDCPKLRNVDFHPVDKGIAQFGASVNALIDYKNAVLRITTPDGFTCTGVLISDNGHVQTASHCMDKCYAEGACQILINDKPQNVKMVAINPCGDKVKVVAEKMQKKEVPTEADLQCTYQNDMNIFRLEQIPEGMKCLPLSDREPGVDENVYTMGYPRKTNRKQNNTLAKDSDGEQMYFSIGKVVKRDYCEEKVHLPGYKTVRKQSVDLQVIEKIGPDTIQTTIDAVGGNSGGPLIDSTGHVLGTTSFTMYNDVDNKGRPTVYCAGSSFFTKTKNLGNLRLSKKLESDLGALYWKSLKCINRRAGSGASI